MVIKFIHRYLSNIYSVPSITVGTEYIYIYHKQNISKSVVSYDFSMVGGRENRE